MRARLALALALLALATPAPLAAQGGPDEREALTTAYMVDVSRELCGFAVSDDQAEGIAKAIDRLEGDLELGDEATRSFRAQIEAQMRAQKAQGLCDPKGAWARRFKAHLDEILAGQ